MEGLKFRIVLDHKDENEIFRDIILPSTATFKHLNDVLLQSFNFTGQEMSSFHWSNDDWDKGEEIPLLDMSFDDKSEVVTMDDYPLDTILNAESKKLLFIYDFLRMWIFYVDFIGKADITEGDLFAIPVAIGNAPEELSKEISLSNDMDALNDAFEEEDDYLDEFESEFGDSQLTSLEDLDFEEHGF